MKKKIEKKSISFIAYVGLGIIFVGLLFFGYKLYEVVTHKLVRKHFTDKEFALSLLVPKGFDLYQEGEVLNIYNKDIKIEIIRIIYPANSNFGTPEHPGNPKIQTTDWNIAPLPEDQAKMDASDNDTYFASKGYRKVIAEGKEELDGTFIYEKNGCYSTASEHEAGIMYSIMYIFKQNTAFDNVRVCIHRLRNDISPEKSKKYDEMVDKMVMSMEDISDCVR